MLKKRIIQRAVFLVLSAVTVFFLIHTTNTPEYTEPIFSGNITIRIPDIIKAVEDTVPSDKEAPENTSDELKEALSEEKHPVIIDVPYINQVESYPNGCETVCAIMALRYFGHEVDTDEFIDNYLDMAEPPKRQLGIWYGPDPRTHFPGDPRSEDGWGCYPEVIKSALDKLSPVGLQTEILKDVPLSELCSAYIDNGIPVLFWATIDMREPQEHITWRIRGSDMTHTWINPFHCLLLVGYDDESFYFNDPMTDKAVPYPADAVETAYTGLGMEALVILREDIVKETEHTETTEATETTEEMP